MRVLKAGALLMAACIVATGWEPAAEARPDRAPERVTFQSADGKTTLVGYVFLPESGKAQRHPAVVMMHGRQGAYSERARTFDAETLSLRHKAWGREWARAGYVAVLVDGFGPRGYPQGFPRGSYESRPAELNEVSIRPLDAYGALAYLRSRGDVDGDRVGLQGWSNGASATISAIDERAPGRDSVRPAGFRAALALYPACGLKGHFEAAPFRPVAPTLLLHGTADEEVSHKRCEALVKAARAAGGTVDIKVYESATHSFDSPTRKRQSDPDNAAATDDAIKTALQFFARHVKGD